MGGKRCHECAFTCFQLGNFFEAIFEAQYKKLQKFRATPLPLHRLHDAGQIHEWEFPTAFPYTLWELIDLMWRHIHCITSDAVSCGGYLWGPTSPARRSGVLGHGALGSCRSLREGVWVTAPGVPWVHMRPDFDTFAALLRAVTVPFPSFVGLQVNKEVPTNESKQRDQSHRVLRGRAELRQDLHLLNCLIPHIAQTNSVLDWCNMAHPLQNGSGKDAGRAPLSSWHDTTCSTCSPYAQAGCLSRQASCGADTPSSPRHPALSPGMVASHQRKSSGSAQAVVWEETGLPGNISISPPALCIALSWPAGRA